MPVLGQSRAQKGAQLRRCLDRADDPVLPFRRCGAHPALRLACLLGVTSMPRPGLVDAARRICRLEPPAGRRILHDYPYRCFVLAGSAAQNKTGTGLLPGSVPVSARDHPGYGPQSGNRLAGNNRNSNPESGSGNGKPCLIIRAGTMAEPEKLCPRPRVDMAAPRFRRTQSGNRQRIRGRGQWAWNGCSGAGAFVLLGSCSLRLVIR